MQLLPVNPLKVGKVKVKVNPLKVEKVKANPLKVEIVKFNQPKVKKKESESESQFTKCKKNES